MTKNPTMRGTTYFKAISQKCSGPTKQYINLGMWIGIFQGNSTVFHGTSSGTASSVQVSAALNGVHCRYSKVIKRWKTFACEGVVCSWTCCLLLSFNGTEVMCTDGAVKKNTFKKPIALTFQSAFELLNLTNLYFTIGPTPRIFEILHYALKKK